MKEENTGLRFAEKFHPMGRMSNTMNDMTYLPALVPSEESLSYPLPPLHRAELREEMARQGIPEPARRLNWRDFYSILKRRQTDGYEGTSIKKEWEEKHKDQTIELHKAWEIFLSQFKGKVVVEL